MLVVTKDQKNGYRINSVEIARAHSSFRNGRSLLSSRSGCEYLLRCLFLFLLGFKCRIVLFHLLFNKAGRAGSPVNNKLRSALIDKLTFKLFRSTTA
jgi:hypothetical protein